MPKRNTSETSITMLKIYTLLPSFSIFHRQQISVKVKAISEMSEVLDSDIDPVPDSKETVVRDSEIGIGSSHAYRPKECAEQPNFIELC